MLLFSASIAHGDTATDAPRPHTAPGLLLPYSAQILNLGTCRGRTCFNILSFASKEALLFTFKIFQNEIMKVFSAFQIT